MFDRNTEMFLNFILSISNVLWKSLETVPGTIFPLSNVTLLVGRIISSAIVVSFSTISSPGSSATTESSSALDVLTALLKIKIRYPKSIFSFLGINNLNTTNWRNRVQKSSSRPWSMQKRKGSSMLICRRENHRLMETVLKFMFNSKALLAESPSHRSGERTI